MKTNPTLICIPDITGFTQFMSDTDIALSSKVITALLNKIIYANQIDLKVSEIEGDAVLFYRTGELPPFNELIEQCKLFFTTFYKQLDLIKETYKKHEGLKDVKNILGLKIVLHYGEEIGAVQIGKSIKLMGEDVIVAHRLLKNDIKSDEYILLSQTLLDQFKDEIIERNFEWGELVESDETYKHIGDIEYSYIKLKPLLDA